MALLVLVAGAGVVAVLAPSNLVSNGDVMYDVDGWDAASEAGPTTVDRLRVSDGPDDLRTVAYVRRPAGGNGSWSRVMVPLHDPSSLKTGRIYSASAWVRNLGGGQPVVGLLLANGNYDHRPTASTAYTRLDGSGWHQLRLTFVATDAAQADTGVYVALPSSGVLSWQITGVALTESALPDAPSIERRAPDRVLGFDGAAGQSPDPSTWSAEVGGGGWGNHELQSYVDDPRSAHVDGKGNLVITARREETTGPDGITRQFSSARLVTHGSVAVAPGSYVEAPIDAPTGQGVWPAFWLLGQNIDAKGWPTAGELDVLEVLGSDPRTARSALHMADLYQSTRDRPYGGDSSVGATHFDSPLDSRTHRYGVYFDQDIVVFYIDHRRTFAYSAADAAASGRSWPFGQPMYLLLNVAVGGQESPGDTQFPRRMRVGPIAIWNGHAPT